MFTHTAAALPPKKRIKTGRRIVAVDIENMIGGAVTDPGQVRWARRSLRRAARVAPSDQVVIGTSHVGLATVGTAWPHLRYVVKSGKNGADLALLEVLGENIEDRYEQVVLASGDGIFTDAVIRLTRAGVHVHVIAHPDGLARRLHMAATHVTLLRQHYHPAGLGDAA